MREYHVIVPECYVKKFIEDTRDYVDKIELIVPSKHSFSIEYTKVNKSDNDGTLEQDIDNPMTGIPPNLEDDTLPRKEMCIMCGVKEAVVGGYCSECNAVAAEKRRLLIENGRII